MAAISSQTVKREGSSPLTSVWWSHGANNPGALPYQRPLKLTSVIPTLSRQVRANHVNSEYHSEIHNTH